MKNHAFIYEPVFRSKVLFYHSIDGKKALEHASKKYHLTFKNGTGFSENERGSIVSEKNRPVWLIWIDNKNDWKAMVHEAAHLVFMIFDYRGILISSDNDETFCYLLEYFIDKFWDEMKK